EAIATLEATAKDAAASPARRENALRTLGQRKDPALVPLLHALLDDPEVASAALKSLAIFNDPQTPSLILKRYASFSPETRQDAVSTLASRPAYAMKLLE